MEQKRTAPAFDDCRWRMELDDFLPAFYTQRKKFKISLTAKKGMRPLDKLAVHNAISPSSASRSTAWQTAILTCSYVSPPCT